MSAYNTPTAWAFGLAVASFAMFAEAPSAAAIFQCEFTETSRLKTAGSSDVVKSNYQTKNHILQFDADLFRTFDATSKQWSPNYCTPTSPEMEPYTACKIDGSTVRAQWHETAVEDVGREDRRAKVTFREEYGYRISPSPDGHLSGQFYKIRNAVRTVYYSKGPDGTVFDGDSGAPTDSWAGYSLKVTGRGPCNKVLQ